MYLDFFIISFFTFIFSILCGVVRLLLWASELTTVADDILFEQPSRRVGLNSGIGRNKYRCVVIAII